MFGDAELNRLMTQAFDGNLELSQAVARWRRAEAAVRSVSAGRRPNLSLEGQAGRQRQATFVGPVTGDYYGLSVAAGFEIDLWKRLASQVEAARFEHRAAAADVDALYLSLSARLADLYFTAVEQRAQQRLLERTIASYGDILKRVERRYRGGIVPALDVYQARQNLSAARARLPQVEARLAAAEHGVAVLLGRYPERNNTGRIHTLPTLEEEYPPGLPSQLLNARPDVQAALLRVRAADSRVAAAIADRFPAFNLTARYGGAADAPRRMFDSPNIFWNLLINLAQPLLDGGRRRAEVDRQRTLFEELLAGYQAQVIEAFREVEDALAAERATRVQVRQLEERRASTAAALRLATDRYLLGLSEYLPVLTAQVLHLETESSLLAARRQLIADRISLGRSLGGRWMMARRQQAGRVPSAPSNEDNRHEK
jgi:NodT family efflux transporter outer membrane factor (OMF) lipoprotein